MINAEMWECSKKKSDRARNRSCILKSKEKYRQVYEKSGSSSILSSRTVAAKSAEAMPTRRSGQATILK